MKLRGEFNNKNFVFHAGSTGGQIWLHVDGVVYLLIDETAQRRKKIQSEEQREVISPMPGKITKVLKQPGDPVQSGDVVVVMEAMKMEYNLKASKAGTVEDVFVKVGDQVSLGALLLRVQ